MTLNSIQHPIPSLVTLWEVLSSNAQSCPMDEVILISQSMTDAQRRSTPVMSLTEHYSRLRLPPPSNDDLERIRLQGWTRPGMGNGTVFAVRPDTPLWVKPFHLVDRCLDCIRAGMPYCLCSDLSLPRSERISFVYTLELGGGNFYIGISRKPALRMESHIHKPEPVWVRRHGMVALHGLEPVPLEEALRMETRKTLDMMAIHGGIAKVRGGKFQTRTRAQGAESLLPQWRQFRLNGGDGGIEPT